MYKVQTRNRENLRQDTYLNIVGALPLVKLNEGRVVGSKATAGVEVGELKLNPPVDADVDDCNITIVSIYLGEKSYVYTESILFLYIKYI